MASGIFTVLDDIATLMDDVAVTTKIATQKTIGILGDDLAVNAEQATGFSSSRELPVIWAIIKGSLINKVIIIPIAIILNIFLPIAIKLLLIFGGLYLAYEGVEKIVEFLFHRKSKEELPHTESIREEIKEEIDEEMEEKAKIKSAIITDFVLSIEIVIIGLSTVLQEKLIIQIITVSLVSLIATVGVYGLVALIVRLDDIGLKLVKVANGKKVLNAVGQFLIRLLPYIIKSFSILGTIALIYVSGEIFVHQVEYFHHLLPQVPIILKEIIYGLVAGTAAFMFISFVKYIYHWSFRSLKK